MRKAIKTVVKLFIISFLFAGCTKDTPKNEKQNALVGSKWQAKVSNQTLSITFIDNKNVSYSESSSSGSTSSKATYVFVAPNIRINIEDKNQPFEYNGEVSTTTMKLTIGYSGPVYNFQKVN